MIIRKYFCRIIGLLVDLAIITGCASLRMDKFNYQKRAGMVSVLVCDACSKPYDWQASKANELMRQKCNGDFEIIEEGESPSGNYQFLRNVAAYQTSRWHYLFKCK